MRRNVDKARQHDSDEIIYNSYNVQNMLINQLNFPFFYHDGDYIDFVWTDRMPYERYRELITKHFDEKSCQWDWGFDSNKMMSFLKDYFNRELTGYRVIRYTNVSSGYPVYLINVFAKSDKTPQEKVFTGQFGDNVERSDLESTMNGIIFDSIFEGGKH